jgi:hypothetical protein
VPTETLNADGEVAPPNSVGKKRRKRKVGGATVVDAKVESGDDRRKERQRDHGDGVRSMDGWVVAAARCAA